MNLLAHINALTFPSHYYPRPSDLKEGAIRFVYEDCSCISDDIAQDAKYANPERNTQSCGAGRSMASRMLVRGQGFVPNHRYSKRHHARMSKTGARQLLVPCRVVGGSE